jgi:hypothetical protein
MSETKQRVFSKRDPRLRAHAPGQVPKCRHHKSRWGYRMLANDKHLIDVKRHGKQSSYNSLIHDHDLNPRASWLECPTCGFFTERLIVREWTCWCGWPRVKPLDTVRTPDAAR